MKLTISEVKNLAAETRVIFDHKATVVLTELDNGASYCLVLLVETPLAQKPVTLNACHCRANGETEYDVLSELLADIVDEMEPINNRAHRHYSISADRTAWEDLRQVCQDAVCAAVGDALATL